MSTLDERLDSHLALRRALGYQLREHEKILGAFVAHLVSRSERVVTVLSTRDFAATAPSAAATHQRVSMVRGFAQYLSAFEPATEIPPPGCCPAAGERRSPYLYSPEELAALLGAARALRPAPWGASMATLIGLLASCGLRPGEAYRLDRVDVDLERGRLVVLNSKLGKSRLLPLHESCVRALGDYAAIRDELDGDEPAFLLNRSGHRITSAQADRTFGRLLRVCSISAAPGRRAPRLYDLRHGFAVQTLIDWHRAGAGVQRELPVLSAYLGHLVPANTYWYLEAAPELLGIIADKLSAALEVER
jgi:integrase